MNEFTKTKMHFTLALLGGLFALHPFLQQFENDGFWYGDYFLKLSYGYVVFAGLLALSVYFFGMTLVSERPHSWLERLGNYCYGLAIMSPLFYGGLYLASLLADRAGLAHLRWTAPGAALGLVVAWFVLAWFLRGRLGAQDRSAKVGQFARQEVKALGDAQELFDNDHYDLSVMEAFRAVEARLRRVLLSRGAMPPGGDPEALLAAAKRAGLLREPALTLLDELARQWRIAVGSEPLTKDGAVAALSAARNILAMIPVPAPAHEK